jgi:hypothetical protein
LAGLPPAETVWMNLLREPSKIFGSNWRYCHRGSLSR